MGLVQLELPIEVEIVEVPPLRPVVLARRKRYRDAFQLPLLLYDSVAIAMERLLWRLKYDDALVRHGWRCEYLYLIEGLPHFRLMCGPVVVGVVDIRAPSQLPRIRRQLTMFLAGCGFTPGNSEVVVFGAKTPLSASKRVAKLFK